MPEGSLIYEGHGKRVYQAEGARARSVEFTDEATTYDGSERASFPSKGALRNHIASVMMATLEERRIPTSYIRPESASRMTVGAVGTFPMEVVCYNAAGGSFRDRIGLTDGELLPFAVVQFYLDRRGPMGLPIKNSRLMETKTISEGDVKIIQTRALLANQALKSMLYKKGYVLAELRLEFGKDASGRIRVADDISPDTCRLWDRADFEKIDRDRFRRDVGTEETSYRKIAQALTD